MAKEKTTPRLPAEGEEVQRRIEAWRVTRRKGTAMPEELWQAAASLARKHGLYTIARGLPLEYAGLKRRVNRLVEVYWSSVNLTLGWECNGLDSVRIKVSIRGSRRTMAGGSVSRQRACRHKGYGRYRPYGRLLRTRPQRLGQHGREGLHRGASAGWGRVAHSAHSPGGG